MKQGSTLFLKGVIFIIALAVLALCVFVLPVGLMNENVGGYLPIIIGMYITTLPFFVAIYHGYKLLSLIDQNKAFSELSVNALNIIKYCAIAITVLYGIGMPQILAVAQRDDAPGVVLIGLVFTFASAVVATIAAVLQKLLANAIELKSENELTV